MIKDKEQFNKFIDLLPDLQDDEVYFLSLSARNKHLTEKERKLYALGRTEMFGRTIVKSKDDFDYAMRKLKSIHSYKYTKNKMLIPKKCLICYVNINPSSTIKAYEMFVNEMNRELFQVTASLKKSTETNYKGFINIERKLMNCIQKSRSRKYYIDIDVDSKNEQILNRMCYRLQGVTYYIIKTHGGWHFLIDKSSLTKDVKLHEIVKEMDAIASDEDGEVIFNRNQMVPVPGTLQAGKLVKII